MQMAPNLVGAGNQQSSARNNNPPALESRPANNPEPKPPIIATTTDLHSPNTRIRVASTVYGSSQLDFYIDTIAWRNRSLGYHAPRVTHRAFSHTSANKLDR
jgi:hypothetical protein